jgi:exopolysaccharide biosynthesis polyprenyl glycosylphosphotransferase
MRKRSELFFSLILVPVDCLALVSAFIVAYLIRVHINGAPVAHPIGGFEFLRLSILVLPIWIVIFALCGLYSLSNLRGRLSEFGKVIVAVSGGVMVLIILDFFSKTTLFPSKAVPIYAYALGIIFVTFGRVVVRGIQRSLFRYGIGVHRVLLIGSGELARRIYANLSRPRSGYHVVGGIDSARGASGRLLGLSIYRNLSEAEAVLSDPGIDQILQADSALQADEILELVTYATNHQLSYRFVPNQFGLYATNASFSDIAGIPMLEIRLTPLDGWGRIIKRIFDLLGATFGLILLSPVFLAIAIAIKIADPGGPVFFRHRRLSRTGGEIFIYKFRSMRQRYSDNTKDPRYQGKTPQEIFELLGHPELVEEFDRDQKVENDPRVSRIGAFLRRTSLDELPQLINAWLGDLSLVGPRPIVPLELDRYGDQSASFLALKPGITGLWQTSGRSDLGYDERVKLDIYYVENWSLWLDFKIIMSTIRVIVTRDGAY